MLRSAVQQLIEGIRKIFFGLRFRLLLLVLLACSPLVGLTLHNASRERRRAVENWADQVQRVITVVRREESDWVRQTRQLLLALSESSAIRAGTPHARQQSLEEVLATAPSYSRIGVTDTNGQVLSVTGSGAGGENNFDERVIRRVLSRQVFTVGGYSGAVTQARPAVTIGCPVYDRANQVQGVVFAVLDLERLGDARSELAGQVPKGAVWAEMNRNGVVIARYPLASPPVGQTYPNPAIVSAILNRRDGMIEAPNLQGVPSFCGFAWRDSQFVPGKVATLLTIPKTVLYAGANQELIRNLVLLGSVVALALGLGWVGSTFLIMRPVKALVRASARLASGDLTTRTELRHGKDELGQLTRTFDAMAEALEQREQERRVAEETLQTRDDMIRDLPLIPAAICVCDHLGNVELYNRTAVELWGGEPQDENGDRRYSGAYELYHADGTPMPLEESPAAEVLRSGLPQRNRELLVGRPDGTRVPVLANVVPIRDSEGALVGAVSCLQDITDRKQAEERLQESNEKLQLLSRRLVETQEAERRHIARELHDEVGQTLTVAEMNLQAVMQSPRASPLARRLKESLRAVERVLGQVRDLSLNLRPSMLDDLGLESALRWYTNRQAKATGLRSEFHSDPLEERLDPVIETACFRVAQEALTNVARHAQAHAVSVSLRRENGLLHLIVRDDGLGFDVAALRRRAVQGVSLGLLSMEERATLVDGGFEVISQPGQGTEVHAFFPIKPRPVDS